MVFSWDLPEASKSPNANQIHVNVTTHISSKKKGILRGIEQDLSHVFRFCPKQKISNKKKDILGAKLLSIHFRRNSNWKLEESILM